MATHYRAVWIDDDGPALISEGLRLFHDWVVDKRGVEVDLPENGNVIGDGFEVNVQAALDETCEIARATLVESDGPDHWSTRLTLLADPDTKEGWVWIDLEWVSEDAFGSVPNVVAPRLARSLLERRGGHLGPTELHVTPRPVRSDAIADFAAYLADPARDVPVLAMTMNRRGDPNEFSERAQTSARWLAGIVDVVMLPLGVEDAFNDRVGAELAVYGGAPRLYLPGLNLDRPFGTPHRYLPIRQVPRWHGAIAQWAGRILGPRLTARRPPELYRTFGHLLLGDTRTAEADDRETIEALESRIERLEYDLLEQSYQAEAWAQQSDRGARVLEALRKRIIDLGGNPWEADADVAASESEGTEFSTCREVVEWARRDCPKVVIPDTATTEIDRLSESYLAKQWADDSARALRALNAFGGRADSFNGGFFQWCQDGEQWAFPTRLVAMRESERVESNPELRALRVFPVHPKVAPVGTIFMPAHLKPGGGATDAPRIHFHDDTRGATGKIHVGYFGPHVRH